jgi:hypothetical protein
MPYIGVVSFYTRPVNQVMRYLPTNHYFRGILAHLSVWLALCAVMPFIFRGISLYGALRSRLVPDHFSRRAGSAAHRFRRWMSPFLIPWLRVHTRLSYHLWVDFGASIALFFYVELQFIGDPRPPAHEFYATSVLAFVTALYASFRYADFSPAEAPNRNGIALAGKW